MFSVFLRFSLLISITVLTHINIAFAAEYQSVLSESATLYKTPSSHDPVYSIKQFTPVEIVVKTDPWVKVRDPDGDMNWINKKDLSPVRTVVVTSEAASVYKEPNEKSAIILRAERSVALERTGSPKPGWIAVRHVDGESGFIRISDIWGE